MSVDTRIGPAPESELPLADRIPRLAKQIVSAPEPKANEALDSLTEALSQQNTFEPVILAFDAIQKGWLSQKRVKDRQRVGVSVDVFILRTLSEFTDRGLINLNLDEPVIEAVTRIRKREMEARRTIPRHRGSANYNGFIDVVLGGIEARYRGVQSIQIPVKDETKEGYEARIADTRFRRWTEWFDQMNMLLPQLVGSVDGIGDTLINRLKEEPIGLKNQTDTFWTRRFGGASLEGIEKLDEEEGSARRWEVLSNYLTGALKGRLSFSERQALGYIFFYPKYTMFTDEENNRIPHEHASLFSKFNHWQEEFIVALVGGEPEKEEKALEILGLMDERMASIFCAVGLEQWTVYPDTYDVDSMSALFHERKNRHPMLRAGQNIFVNENSPAALEFTDIREVCTDFLWNTVIPIVAGRARQVGSEQLFKRGLDRLQAGLGKDLFKEVHMSFFKKLFEERSGDLFTERLVAEQQSLEDIKDRVWTSLSANTTEIPEDEVHFIPMDEAVNIVTFAEDSLPGIIGIDEVKIMTFGDLAEWQTKVNFTLFGGSMFLNGYIDSLGDLQCRIRVKEEMPTLYALLNTVAVLALHDLMVQHAHEQKSGIKSNRHRDRSAVVQSLLDVSVVTVRRGVLPREQKDTSLVADVYRKRGIMKPRVVELHKMALPGRQAYLDAVALYNQAIAQGEDAEMLEFLKTEVEEARRQSRQASSEKIAKLPKMMQLEVVVDPITGERRYPQTWRKRHTVPVPTDEELQSPARLYQRYYQGASSLAFLDQLKPWLISDLDEATRNGEPEEPDPGYAILSS